MSRTPGAAESHSEALVEGVEPRVTEQMAGGLKHRVLEWGARRDDRPSIVMVHGYLDCAGSFSALASQLSGSYGFHCIAADVRGHGGTEWVGQGGYYHFFDYVADVDALVSELGGEVDLVGHSMGGTIACYFAGAIPSAVRRLVLIEGLGPPDGSHAVLEQARKHLSHRRALPRHRAVEGVSGAAKRIRSFNPRISQREAERLAARLLADDHATWRWDPLHRARNPKPFTTAGFDPFLRAITAPVLLVDGAESPVDFPDLVRRRSLITDTRRVVMGGGHLLHHEDPQALAQVIGAFLDG